MAAAKTGDTVQVHYTGKLTDGTVFDSSQGRDPLEFKLGEGRVIEGFENAIVGLEPGDSTTTTIEPDNAYGPRRDELTIEVPKNKFPDHISPTVGQQLEMMQQNGQPVQVTVIEVGDEQVTLDANHPLAGQTLVFDIELVNVA